LPTSFIGSSVRVRIHEDGDAPWRSRYYVYAIDYDRGGEWMGQAVMCTREKEFTIRGIDDRLAAAMTAPGFPNLVPGATGLDRAID
jgi:uncharacterized membrane protein